jgi:hypothetical protein
MIKYLKDCKVGDKVRLWCIGWRAWDDVVVEIVDNGVSSLIKVKYPSGRTGEFVPTTECHIEVS